MYVCACVCVCVCVCFTHTGSELRAPGVVIGRGPTEGARQQIQVCVCVYVCVCVCVLCVCVCVCVCLYTGKNVCQAFTDPVILYAYLVHFEGPRAHMGGCSQHVKIAVHHLLMATGGLPRVVKGVLNSL